jgi:hypothetical protein
MRVEHSAAAIEASRRRLNIPADYDWSDCAGNCGDIVWHPPLDAEQAASAPFIMACSAACAMAALAAQKG